MHVIVIGAGIMGSACAHALARDGHAVSLIDAGHAGASAASFGWINASFHLGPEHHALRAHSMSAWRRLDGALSLGIDWAGCLCWENQGAALDAQARDLRAHGYPLEMVEARALRQALPMLKSVPERALLFAGEGAMDASAVAARLRAHEGLRCYHGVTVQEIVTSGGRVRGVRTDAGFLGADHVLVAAGNGARALVEKLGVALPMLARPGLILRTARLDQRLGRILVGPFGELRQDRAGRLHLPISVSHQSDDSEAIEGAAGDLADEALDRLKAHFDLPGLEWERVMLGWRPVPEDGLPVIGRAGPEGLSLAVMHSGVTLAAGVAEGLAREIAGQGEAAAFAPFRARRFAAGGISAG